jgi:hypothetical protein
MSGRAVGAPRNCRRWISTARSFTWFVSLAAPACLSGCSQTVDSRSVSGARAGVVRPALNIPGTRSDDSVNFLDAVGGTVLASETIVIVDNMRPGLEFFTLDGRLVRVVGRSGAGPGEFTAPSWIGQCAPDSLFVWDRDRYRMTVLDSVGRVVREFQVSPSTSASGGFAPGLFSCARAGLFAVLGLPLNSRPYHPNQPSPHFSASLLTLDGQGRVIRDIGTFPVYQDRPLGVVTKIAALGDRIFIGTEDSAYIDRFDFNGERHPGLRLGSPLRHPSLANFERVIDQRVSGFTDKSQREFWRKRFLSMPMPEYLPAYSALFADSEDERLWVQISIPGDSTTVLRAVGLDGKIQGDVTLRQDLTVFNVAHGYILGEYDDSGGDQHVVLYKIPDKLQPITNTAGGTTTP